MPVGLHRKKPVTIRAVQFNEHTDEIADFLGEADGGIGDFGRARFIKTLEGEMRADIGDWLIEGVNGEKYPCKPDIFEKTYEPVAREPVTEQLIVSEKRATIRVLDPLPEQTEISLSVLNRMDRQFATISGSRISIADERGIVEYRVVGWNEDTACFVVQLLNDYRTKESANG